VQQQAELHLQSAQCHVLLDGEDEAVAQLHAAITCLEQKSQSSCR
jgi:hypothetical protein